MQDSVYECFHSTTAYKFEDLSPSQFGERQGCRVTLYRDAHASATEKGQPDAWADMWEAISTARKFILLTAWSFNPHVAPIRTPQKSETADEGVAVCILLWDEATSLKLGPIYFKGFAGTDDESAEEYFKGTRVHIETVERRGSREIVSFVGGLDFCSGRYDTPDHQLFSTLGTFIHKNDAYNVRPPLVGPRMPWHDLHSKVEGPAAWDVVTNFQQRWAKQAKDKGALPRLLSDDYDLKASGQSNTQWNVEIVRSIDPHSALGILKVESGIQRSYVLAIREAKDFLYIEDQFFCGSSPHWLEKFPVPCYNLIPLEIAERVCRSIRDGRPFHVYVVIPLHPEGDPAGGMNQQILLWQRRTMNMMYNRIAQEIKARGSSMRATDYLSFYFLGQRETPPPLEMNVADEYQQRAAMAGRFMIYVHSKLLIADDRVVLVGSANTNERSMSGDRDTDMNIVAYQPHGGGDVKAYRKALWEEHGGPELAGIEHPGLMTCGTLEEKISRKQVFKQSLMKTTMDEVVPYRYFTNQELRELFEIGETKFSETQTQLLEIHHGQRRETPELAEHVQWIESRSSVAGVSDHDLLFSVRNEDHAEATQGGELDDVVDAAEQRIEQSAAYNTVDRRRQESETDAERRTELEAGSAWAGLTGDSPIVIDSDDNAVLDPIGPVGFATDAAAAAPSSALDEHEDHRGLEGQCGASRASPILQFAADDETTRTRTLAR
eukprot:m51a1_g12002 putative phospholipase d epsilon-like (720) ;mRNA; f:4553-7718